jgi:hypothetical protein
MIQKNPRDGAGRGKHAKGVAGVWPVRRISLQCHTQTKRKKDERNEVRKKENKNKRKQERKKERKEERKKERMETN